MNIIIIPGATPKETTSASESNCFPKSLEMESNRATKPSKKSQIIAMKSSATA